MTHQASEINHSTSTGHNLVSSTYLDKHYQVAQFEYEATLRSAGLQPGWHVLDAGCGGGAFLPLMSEIVGASGKISAIDLAPEHINAIGQSLAEKSLACPVETRVGSLVSLPYENDQFDAVWSANVTQYLTDEELTRTLAEFVRVVRPGGIVAVKDVDISAWQFQPLSPTLMWRLIEACQGNGHVSGAMRGTHLPTWLREAGLKVIKRQTTLVERWSPLQPLEQSYVADNLKFLSHMAADLDLRPKDIATWHAIGEAPEQLINHSDFCYREMYILAVGQVPS